MKPRHSTRPRFGSSLMESGTAVPLPVASANLGGLRSTFGLFEVRGSLGGRRRGFLREAQLQQIPRRHGVFAADDDDLAEQPFQPGGGVAVDGSLAAEDA